jgi:hypothetical protein
MHPQEIKEGSKIIIFADISSGPTLDVLAYRWEHIYIIELAKEMTR